jgi:hypothetical protein
LAKLGVEINEEKSRVVDLRKDESFAFLGFEYRYLPGRSGKLRLQVTPKQKKRVALFAKLREVFRRHVSQPVRGRDHRDQSHPSRLGELLSDRPFEPLLFDGQALGGAKDSAAHDERPAASRDGLETVEYAVDSRHARSLQRLPSEAASIAESCSGFIGRLSFDAKTTGERSAGDPHAPFDAAGIGNQFTVGLVRHSQRKRGATDRPNLRSVAPILDPT